MRTSVLLILSFTGVLTRGFGDCTSCSNPVLPTAPVMVHLDFNVVPNFYWQATLSGVLPGFSVSAGRYHAWCSDTFDFWVSGTTHLARLYSSYDPSLPVADQNPNWAKVNWLINHKNPLATFLDVQNAIWLLLGQPAVPSQPPDHPALTTAMYSAALANGTGFHPGEGQVIAIIVDPNFDPTIVAQTGKRQVTFFELGCPLTLGFWKNHVQFWPSTTINLGFRAFSTTNSADVQVLLNIFNTPVQGHANIDLEHQLIAAELNIAAGSNPAPVQATITASIQALASSGGVNVSASSAFGQVMTNLSNALDQFNEGTLPGVCAAN